MKASIKPRHEELVKLIQQRLGGASLTDAVAYLLEAYGEYAVASLMPDCSSNQFQNVTASSISEQTKVQSVPISSKTEQDKPKQSNQNKAPQKSPAETVLLGALGKLKGVNDDQT